jgi:hypothetical protein
MSTSARAATSRSTTPRWPSRNAVRRGVLPSCGRRAGRGRESGVGGPGGREAGQARQRNAHVRAGAAFALGCDATRRVDGREGREGGGERGAGLRQPRRAWSLPRLSGTPRPPPAHAGAARAERRTAGPGPLRAKGGLRLTWALVLTLARAASSRSTTSRWPFLDAMSRGAAPAFGRGTSHARAAACLGWAGRDAVQVTGQVATSAASARKRRKHNYMANCASFGVSRGHGASLSLARELASPPCCSVVMIWK